MRIMGLSPIRHTREADPHPHLARIAPGRFG